MYEAYWGLKEKPFENTPDPKFIYYSPKHKEALARLIYVVREHKGAALLTGDYGSGKTLLSRVLWHELQKENLYQSVFILNPRLTGLEFVQEIAHQLTGTDVNQNNKIELFHQLHKIFYSNHTSGKHSVIVVDEAQAIQENDIFEELRLLLNFQLDNAFLLTIVLIGQPELKSIVSNMPQLSQRMAVKYHLTNLDEQETREYILHRLTVAGGAGKAIFDDDVFKDIYHSSLGTPRRINTICDLSLLVGYGSGLKSIDKKTIAKIRDDVDAEGSEVPKS